MTPGPDVVDVLVADHELVEGLLEQALRTEGSAPPGDPQTSGADRVLAVCIAELARHLVVEEEYVYPVVREVLPSGAQLAEDGLNGTREAEWLMKQLERSEPSATNRTPLLMELLRVLRRHIRETEAQLFPGLRSTCAPDQLGHLAGVVEMAKRTAPTHAHPKAPHHTPWNQILTPSVGLVDRIRDTVTGRPSKPEQM